MTEFFVPIDKTIQDLKEKSKVAIKAPHYEALIKLALQCHRCKMLLPTIPKLKHHIASCKGTIKY
jgi:hypothetical protein